MLFFSVERSPSDKDGAWVSVDDEPEPVSKVIVSNHVSYLDILLHMGLTFPSFVAGAGTLKVPLVGKISQAMGCVYVKR